MATGTPTATEPGPDRAVEDKISQLRELFADAPEVGRTALENVLNRLTSDASKTPPPPVQSAGRAGSRLGKVSELTIIVPSLPAELSACARSCGCSAATSPARTRSAAFTTCASCSWTTTPGWPAWSLATMRGVRSAPLRAGFTGLDDQV